MTTSLQLFVPAICATIFSYMFFGVMISRPADPVGSMAILVLTFPAMALAIGALIARPKKHMSLSIVIMLFAALATLLAALGMFIFAIYSLLAAAFFGG